MAGLQVLSLLFNVFKFGAGQYGDHKSKNKREREKRLQELKQRIQEQERQRREEERQKQQEERLETIIIKLSFVLSIISIVVIVVMCHYSWWPTLFIGNSWWVWIIIVLGIILTWALLFYVIYTTINWILH